MKKILFTLTFFSFAKIQAQEFYIKNGTTVTVKKVANSLLPNIYVVGSLQNDGTFSDAGTIQVTGDFTNKGTLEHSIAGTVPGDDYDQIVVGGTATLTGSTLTENFTNGYTPVGGENFYIFVADSVKGVFVTTNLPALTAGLSWATAYNSPSGTVKLSISAVVLPIELLDFSAKTIQNTVQLRWETAVEKDAQDFSLERSENGIDFYEINNQKAKGPNSNYEYLDKNPVQGINYYRLISKDLDGSKSSSEIVTATINREENTLKIYPTIVVDRLMIQADKRAIGSVYIINEIGQILWKNTSEADFLTIDTQNMVSGVYFVTVQQEGKSFVQKIVKR